MDGWMDGWMDESCQCLPAGNVSQINVNEMPLFLIISYTRISTATMRIGTIMVHYFENSSKK